MIEESYVSFETAKLLKEVGFNVSTCKHYDPDVSKYSQGKQVGYLRGFNAGAEYALSHQWISVEEALPEDEEYVIALIEGVPVIAKGIHVKENLKDITHWMPIPKFETKRKE